MQCAECREVYSDSLDVCPQCQSAAPRRAPANRAARRASASASGGDTASASAGGTATVTATSPPAGSTLIEFPGRAPRPQWRKDLSERVREIQQRRAREAALEREAALAAEGVTASVTRTTPAATQAEQDEETRSRALGLVPQPETPEMNPIVAAALRRLERARQTPPPAPRSRAQGAAATAAAVAFDAEESYRPAPAQVEPVRAEATPAAHPEARRVEAKLAQESPADKQAAETARAAGLVVVPSTLPAPEATPELTKAATAPTPSVAEPPAPPKPNTPAPATSEVEPATTRAEGARRVAARETRRVLTERREAEITDAANSVPVVESRSVSDRAPTPRRLFAGALDLFVAGVCSLPFAAIIELTSGRWNDARVLASLAGIVVVVAFLYLVVSTGLFGRTLGMRLFGLRAVDARNALVPTTAQSVRRAFFYLLSLATFGVGLLYALFDAEGRTAHDHLSGTIVVRE